MDNHNSFFNAGKNEMCLVCLESTLENLPLDFADIASCVSSHCWFSSVSFPCAYSYVVICGPECDYENVC